MLVGAVAVGALAAVVPGTVSSATTQGSPATARNILLCHGDDVGNPCATTLWTTPGDEETMTALVTDRGGAPVGGVPVEFREDGPATFVPDGTDRVVVVTGADGRASATVVVVDELAETESSTIEAEISPVGTPGGFRGPATHDDECEQPSDTDGSPGAGNCVSGPLLANWEVPPPPPECSDGHDNDADGDVDMDDPSCSDELDPTEGTTDPVSGLRAERNVSLRFGEWRRDRMVVFGRVKTPTGPPECIAGVPVRILRRKGGRWVPLAFVTTSREGWYVVVLPDRPGRYRATALRYETFAPVDEHWVCRKAFHAKRHRHEG